MSKKDICSLFDQLSVFSKNDEHSKITNTCLELLSMGCSNGEQVLKRAITSLIKQDKYKRCVDLFQEYEELAKDNMEFGLLKLYTLYKLNDIKNFEELWNTIKPSFEEFIKKGPVRCQERALLHIRAQFCYKIGKYDETFKIYQLLAKKNDVTLDDDTELGCNERAPLSMLVNQEAITKMDFESYDLLFNEAIIKSVGGEYGVALELLEKALELAKKEPDTEAIQMITLQSSYVLQHLGYNKKSRAILMKLSTEIDSSSPLVPIIKTNMKSHYDLSKYTENCNIQLALRELDAETITSARTDRYSASQWEQLQANTLFLRLFSNTTIKTDRSFLGHALSQYSALVSDICMEPYKSQANKLLRYVTKSNANKRNFGILLITMQLQLKIGNIDCAIKLGETYWNHITEDSLTYNSRLLSYILISLYEKSHRDNSLRKHLTMIVAKFNKYSAEEDFEFWKFIGFKELGQNKTESASNIFSILSEINPSDRLIQMAINGTNSNFESNINHLVSQIDVIELINIGSNQFTNAKKFKPAATGKVSKRRRVHNKKPPLNYDPNRVPDPERWLPFGERSTYRPKKKLARNTQGSNLKKSSEHTLDITKQKKRTRRN